MLAGRNTSNVRLLGRAKTCALNQADLRQPAGCSNAIADVSKMQQTWIFARVSGHVGRRRVGSEMLRCRVPPSNEHVPYSRCAGRRLFRASQSPCSQRTLARNKAFGPDYHFCIPNHFRRNLLRNPSSTEVGRRSMGAGGHYAYSPSRRVRQRRAYRPTPPGASSRHHGPLQCLSPSTRPISDSGIPTQANKYAFQCIQIAKVHKHLATSAAAEFDLDR